MRVSTAAQDESGQKHDFMVDGVRRLIEVCASK
jgi:hypothetical protein